MKNDKTSAGLALELFDQGINMDKIKILFRGILSWKESGYPLVTKGE